MAYASDPIKIAGELRSHATTATAMRELRRTSLLAADALEKPPPIRWARPWPHAAAGFVLGLALAILLYHTLLAPPFRCEAYAQGTFTCARR
jgi:hypothetical protein